MRSRGGYGHEAVEAVYVNNNKIEPAFRSQGLYRKNSHRGWCRNGGKVKTGNTNIGVGTMNGGRSVLRCGRSNAATSAQDDDCLAEAEGKALISASGSSVPRRNFLPFLSVMRTVANPETR